MPTLIILLLMLLYSQLKKRFGKKQTSATKTETEELSKVAHEEEAICPEFEYQRDFM